MPDGDISVRRANAARAPGDPIATRSGFLVELFCWYVRLKMRGSFHALRIARADFPVLPDGAPVLIYANHPSWWDPALCFVLTQRLFPPRAGFGPMDAASLERYAIFKRLGVFGVSHTPRGAARFLDAATRVLERPDSILWVTAEGAFTDARTRPVRLRPGIAHLARRVPGAVIVPMALEYTYWNESKPEVLVQFGPAMIADASLSVAEWTARLEFSLAAAMESLALAAIARDAGPFVTLSRSAVGVGGPYDWWRRLLSALAGRRFDPTHGGGGA